MRRKKIFLWILTACVVVGVVGAFTYRFVVSGEKSEDSRLSTITVQRGDITRTVSATGFLSARASVDLKASKSGTIEELLVEEGDTVKGGQVLARFEDEEEKVSLVRAENALKDAQLELESARVSRASTSEIQRREREVKEKKLEVALAEKELKDTVLTAPFSGIVSKVYVEEGELAAGESLSSSREILRLVDTSSLFVEVNVDEVDIAQVREGQRVKVSVDAYPDEIFRGKVVSICPETTTISGLVVVEVKVKLQEANPKLKSGFTASADIVVAEAKDVIILPVEEVKEKGGRHLVTVLQDGKPAPREVKAGISDGAYVEIKSGLQEGELVLSTGLQGLIEMRKREGEEERRSPGRGMMFRLRG
ncbi:MAG: efflux RND transporter periplasmic adaptor subunit [Candidatus Aerophobetes bacterium]|nr:efflux RND transporter periplasmic adaptor subunit [Candidatus Aerophobetes bacterium]